MSNLLQYASVLDVHQIPMDQFHGEHEEFQMMQTRLTPPESMQKGSNAGNSSEDDPIPLDWMIDLQRIVQQHVDQCQADPQTEFLFSVYTWFLDHNSQKVCREPKIATLGGDPTEWEEDILQPWQTETGPTRACVHRSCTACSAAIQH